MNVEAKRVAKYLYEISGVDVFENNRRRYTIEARSLFTFVLRNHFDMTFHQIKEFYQANGKSYNHATAIHSLKAFEMHRRYSKFLDKWLTQIQLLLRNKEEIKKGLLKNRIEYLYANDLDKLLRAANNMKLKEIDGKEQTKEKRNPPV
tara:strand:- start:51 stop:494 length:444 start_codon:yes stop_codon:yes gene_type:complete